MNSISDTLFTTVDQAMGRSIDYLFRVQRPAGEWRDFTASSALGTAVCVLTLHYADREEYATPIQRGCAWLRQTQHQDGGWGDAVVDPGNLNATGFALPVLKIVDPERSADAIERAMAFLEVYGGPEALSDPQRCSFNACCSSFMALAGVADYPWERVPRLPVELILLPKRIWQKMSFTIPAVFSLGLMYSRKRRLPFLLRWLIKLAEPRALTWLRKAQGENGSYQESPIMTPTVSIGLQQAGIGKDIIERCLAFIAEHQREDGSWTCQRFLEVSVTTYILEALEAAGYLDDSRLQPTIDWLFYQQFDEAFFATGCPAGAWSWGRPSGWADMDDTAGALTMLRRMGVPANDPHIRIGYACLEAMQNRDGSWGMFVKDSPVQLDKPCPALTARIAIAFYERDHSLSPPLKRALQYLRKVQRPDGAIHNLWFRDYVYGTTLALDAFATTGQEDDPFAVKCRDWLLANQNEDGSWGGSRGIDGTVEETAWAISALLAPKVQVPTECLDKAIAWLVEQQRPDGTWPQSVLGVYFPSLWYSDDHIANGFALRALGQYWRVRTGKPYSALTHKERAAK
jgi:squalene-hopene/tetraprenyl-beta-curcumene cyclase